MRQQKAARPTGTRPLKVGETLRHTLSQILQRGEVHDPALARHNVTISEVRMSPDLRHATVFCAPLGGQGAEEMLKDLRRCQPLLRTEVAHAVKLRYAPELHFHLDTSYDYAESISNLLNGDPIIASDLKKAREIK
jgi:ribosome-binding factor A